MKRKSTKFSPEMMERAVRIVEESAGQHESQWGAIESVAAKIGCTSETLRRRVRQRGRDTGQREGATTAEQECLASAGLADAGRVDVIAHQLREPVRRERLAQVRQEQRAVVATAGQFWAHVVAVLGDPVQGALADGDHAVLLAFALADHHRATVGVHVVHVQGQQPHAPHGALIASFLSR